VLSLGRASALVGSAGLVAAVVARAASDSWDGRPRTVGALGAALAVTGLVLLFVAPAVTDPADSRARRVLQVALPVVLLALIMPATAALAAQALSDPDPFAGAASGAPLPADDSAVATTAADHGTHDTTGPFTGTTVSGSSPNLDALEGGIAQGLTPISPTTLTPTTRTPTTTTPGEVDVAPHGVAVPEQPLDAATRAALGAQLVRARTAALQFPTVTDAERAGYRMVTPYVKGIGAHYMNFSLVDSTFDVDHPEMLLYDGTAPTARIVGLSYYVLSGDAAPDGFAGPNDHWHQHIGLCIKGTVVVGGEKLSEAECTARGGVKSPGTGAWMVHAWVVPGWESPQGVFSPSHVGLT